MTNGVKEASSADQVSPTTADSTAAQMLKGAMAHLRAGRLEQAKTELEDMRQRYPKDAAPVHFLGLMAHQQGKNALAIDLLEKSIEMNHVVPYFYGNLAEVCRATGRYDEAIKHGRKAIELYPVYPEALNTLGAALLEQRELEDAAQTLRKAIEFKPDLAAAHANLGNVLMAQGRIDRAAKSFEMALRRDPKLAGAHMALGSALRALGRVKEAIEIYRKGLEIWPDDAKIWSSLGMALRRQDKTEEALECFQKAVALRPDLSDLHVNLGTALVVLDRMDEAVESYATALRLKREPSWDRPDAAPASVNQDRTFRFTTAAKLRHDLEQYRYLMDKGRLPESFAPEVAAHEAILAELDPSGDGQIALTTAQRAKISGSYNRLVYLSEAPAVAGPAVNPKLDFSGIEARYLEIAPGVAYFDDMLTPEALSALRQFCLESTLWFDCSYPNGYLGAYLSDGFSCGLLFQIAEELRQGLPKIFAGHKLRQMRGYKYGGHLTGIERHADAAAVNVNFWITPDAANLDQETGGLEVYTREAPPEWNFDKYNNDQKALAEFVAGGDSLVVPHRQNRAVMFNSNLVHKTDAPHFREGYENRCINITMLFGQRGVPAGG